MSDFELEIRRVFLDEARQTLEECEACYLELEGSPGNHETYEKLFRLAHNLKGSSKAVGFLEIARFTHELETFFIPFKAGGKQLSSEVSSFLLRCNDVLQKAVDTYRDGGTRLPREFESCYEALRELNSGRTPAVLMAKTTPLVPESDVAPMPQGAMPQGAMPPQDGDIIWVNPLQQSSQGSAPAQTAPRESATSVGAGLPSEESIRVALGRIEKLQNAVGELVILETVLRDQILATMNPRLKKTLHQLERTTREVQDLSMGLRLVPMKQLYGKLNRIVRDTALTVNKQVEFVTEGENTEVDKIVLDRISDPLVHMVRNAVDHGIEETAADRTAQGKSPTGKVTLRSYHKSGALIVDLEDDGRGLSAEALVRKAVEKGLLRSDARLTEQEAFQIIFLPGFSTKHQVTEVSGRGVGMDVVKRNIEAAQGRIFIESVPGKGSLFRIQIPLTLAIVDALVVREGGERYVIPLNHIHESMKVLPDDVRESTSLGRILVLRGENIPVFDLHRVFRAAMPTTPAVAERIAIVVRSGEHPVALLVDDIVGRQQVVVKPLGDDLRQPRGLVGGAILGDGRAALILEPWELVAAHGFKGGNHSAPPSRAGKKVAA